VDCKAPRCPRPYHANGYCAMHNARVARTGSAAAPYRSMTAQEKFWVKVDKNGSIPAHRPELGPCWLWTGERQKEGYGRISTRKKPTASGTRLAHRASYELLVKPIPDGLHLDHLCRNPQCVNPADLDPVTPKVNTERGLHGALRTHCQNNHELTPENTYVVSPDNSRRCRTCIREKAAEEREDPAKRETKLAATRRWRERQSASVRQAYELAGDSR
jgi:hypothetical protein